MSADPVRPDMLGISLSFFYVLGIFVGAFVCDRLSRKVSR